MNEKWLIDVIFSAQWKGRVRTGERPRHSQGNARYRGHTRCLLDHAELRGLHAAGTAPRLLRWRAPGRRLGGPSEHFADIDWQASSDQVLFDGQQLSYTSGGALFRLPLTGGTGAPFARESPAHRIQTLQFVDSTSVYWTNRETGVRDEAWLVRADKQGGRPRILGPTEQI